MKHCVNINSREFKDLIKAANMNPVILAAKVSIWQEENGLDKFPKLSQLMSENAINYVMDAANILSSPEADTMFKKAEKNRWSLDKTLTELQIPKTQKQIILESGKTNRRDIVVDLLVNHSYAVEINTAKFRTKSELDFEAVEWDKMGFPIKYKNKITGELKDEVEENTFLPTQHYSNLTVPGGTNYTENEIATPAITPTIKGHAQFATDNGIGWFRSDDQAQDNLDAEKEIKKQYEESGLTIPYEQYKLVKGVERGGIVESSKTRRILEVQSDLFQKGRDKEDLIAEIDTINPDGVSSSVDKSSSKENQFLQLLNKDNNWVTFFVKSIIQDSAKKGYEKVLFPTGNTASKVEGHSTLEEFKKQKEDRIKELEKTINDSNKGILLQEKQLLELEQSEDNYFGSDIQMEIESIKSQIQADTVSINRTTDEINQLKQELERVETEGFGALKPIYNFYENTVTNILKKQGYNPVLITDEYGNTWNEVVLDENKKQSISLTSKNFNNFVNEAYEDCIFSFLTKESDHIEYFNNCK